MTITAAYVHIPFCIRKCLYCDFNSFPGNEELYQSYVEALRAEIRQAAKRFPDARISTIYFGGGTPNVLSSEQLACILGEIRQSFEIDENAEISTEANPGAVSHSPSPPFSLSSRSLRAAGFNRLSLGVQSFHDAELRLLGRIHSAGEAVQAFRDARAAGFGSISIDLMYGIPGQTLESWQDTLRQAVDLGSEHVSLYSLTVEEGTPFHAMQVEGRLTLPGDDVEADMYEEAISTLTSAGFVHYEISNFARPGFECRHNITYWHNEPYFGFGSGATGFVPVTDYESRITNVASVDEYIRRIQAGESPVECEEHLTGKPAMGETMFLGLRLLSGVEIDAFARRYGVLPQEAFPQEIANLTSRGLIEISHGQLRLTRRGLFLANDVFSEFVG
jgi:oxygen-independent coproporphyrinogen-3 oxidase